MPRPGLPPEWIRRYYPMLPPVYAPLADWNDEPCVCVSFNEEWVKLLVGVMEVLRWPDLFDDSNGRALPVALQVQELMDVFNTGNTPCGDDICTVIAHCVETNQTTQDAIQAVQATNGSTATTGGFPGYTVSEERRKMNMLPSTFVCDNDHAFAMARAIVEAIHSAVVECLQAIELATNKFELAAEISDNIPGIGVGVGTPLDTINWIQNTITEIYEAAWSEQTRDYIACDLYCIIVQDDNCTISFEQIMMEYYDIFSDPPNWRSSIEEWFDWLIHLPLTSNVAIVKAGGLMGLIPMAFGGRFARFVLGIQSLEVVMALASDEESNDWQVLCDVCGDQWEATAFLDQEDLPAYYVQVDGDYVQYEGLWATCFDAVVDKKKCSFTINTGSDWDGLRYSLQYKDMQVGSNGLVTDPQAQVEDGPPGSGLEGRFAIWYFGQVMPGEQWLTAVKTQTITNTGVSFWLQADYRGCTGAARLTGVRIRGQGTCPFENQSGWDVIWLG